MSSVRHFVRDDQMVLGFDNHLHVVADHPRAPATGSHRAGIRVGHRQLTVWTVFEPLLDVIQRAHLFAQTFDLVVEPIGPNLDLDRLRSVRSAERRQIAADALLNLLLTFVDLGGCEVFVACVDCLEFASINGNQGLGE